MKLYKDSLDLSSRNTLPLNGPGNYRVVNKIIYTRAIEVNAAKNCNLSCRSCSHCSPITSPCMVDPQTLYEDLSTLKKFLKCETVRVLGGEPLLHNDLLSVLKSIKKSNISQKTCLVTNGVLLHVITEEMLKYIDKVEISLYPVHENLKKRILFYAQKISQNGTSVSILEYNEFRESVCQKPTMDAELIQLIYNTCQIAHSWRCITIDNGKIFRCPQSMVAYNNKTAENDFLIINQINSYRELLNFLENNNYLFACKNCLGSIGKKFKHQQVDRKIWKQLLPNVPENGVDYHYAEQLLDEKKFVSDCFEKTNL